MIRPPTQEAGSDLLRQEHHVFSPAAGSVQRALHLSRHGEVERHLCQTVDHGVGARGAGAMHGVAPRELVRPVVGAGVAGGHHDHVAGTGEGIDAPLFQGAAIVGPKSEPRLMLITAGLPSSLAFWKM